MADSMQTQAMERVRQMYQRASTQSEPVQNVQSVHSAPVQSADTLQNVTEPELPKQTNLLDIFMRDKEKSLIVLLIVILLSEKADQSLILALMYLIL